MKLSVGVVGLGAMGGPIAERLARQGMGPQVVDPNPQTTQYFVAEGGSGVVATPLNLAQMSQIVLLALPDDASLRDAVTGPNGIQHGLKAGSLVVDLSNGDVGTAQALSRGVVSRGAQWIEAVPVGSPKDAAAGRLKMLVGGREDAIERARPVLEVLAERHVRTGDVGSAALAKSLGGVLAGLNLIAAAEVLIVGARSALTPAATLEALDAIAPATGGAALPPALEAVLSRRFQSGETLTRLVRDIDRAQSAARATSIPTPLTSVLRDICAAARLNLDTSEDQTEAVRWLERVARTKLTLEAPIHDHTSAVTNDG